MFTEDDVVSRYTRAQALADGLLIDVRTLAAEAGFRAPVALTQAVWEDCVEWTDDDTARKRCPQDITGRLWDVLWLGCSAMHRAGTAEHVHFVVYRVPRAGGDRRPRPVTLVARKGPGDDGTPVVTITQLGED